MDKIIILSKQALYYAVNNDAIGSFWEDVTKSLEQVFIKYGFDKYLREESAYYSRDRAETIDDFSHRKYHRLMAEFTKSIENRGALDHLLHEMLDQHIQESNKSQDVEDLFTPIVSCVNNSADPQPASNG